MSGDTQSRHCLWLMLAASLLHIADTGSGYVGHTRRVLSPAPETMVVPSGLNATLVTKLVWPGSGWPTGFPVTASHTRTDPSMLPEAINLPSGLNATYHPPQRSDQWTVIRRLRQSSRGYQPLVRAHWAVGKGTLQYRLGL